MFCVKCGSSLTDGVKLCPQCGAAVQVESEAQTGTETQSSHDSPINRGESTGVLRWLKILFWGSLVCGALSDIISTKPFWSASSDFIEFVFSNSAFVLLTVYVLRGAKWARISCYIVGALILCTLGIEAVEDVPFGTWKEGGTISFLLVLIFDFGFIVGSGIMLATNPLKTFEGCKAQPKNCWMVCLAFWMLLVGGCSLSCYLEDDKEPALTNESEPSKDFWLTGVATNDNAEKSACKTTDASEVEDAVKHAIKPFARKIGESSKGIWKEGGRAAEAICKGIVLAIISLFVWLWKHIKRLFGRLFGEGKRTSVMGISRAIGMKFFAGTIVLATILYVWVKADARYDETEANSWSGETSDEVVSSESSKSPAESLIGEEDLDASGNWLTWEDGRIDLRAVQSYRFSMYYMMYPGCALYQELTEDSVKEIVAKWAKWVEKRKTTSVWDASRYFGDGFIEMNFKIIYTLRGDGKERSLVVSESLHSADEVENLFKRFSQTKTHFANLVGNATR